MIDCFHAIKNINEFKKLSILFKTGEQRYLIHLLPQRRISNKTIKSINGRIKIFLKTAIKALKDRETRLCITLIKTSQAYFLIRKTNKTEVEKEQHAIIKYKKYHSKPKGFERYFSYFKFLRDTLTSNYVRVKFS